MVSGYQMLHQAQVLPPVVADGHKTMVAAIVKKFSQDNKPKAWATIKQLETIGRIGADAVWAGLFFLLPGSAVYMWRVGDAAAIM